MCIRDSSYNDKNQSKYVASSSNQTYLPITINFGGHRRLSSTLLSYFWSTSPNNDEFWPHISPILLSGASYNDKNQSKYVVSSSNQTYLPITTHFGGHRRFSGKF